MFKEHPRRARALDLKLFIKTLRNRNSYKKSSPAILEPKHPQVNTTQPVSNQNIALDVDLIANINASLNQLDAQIQTLGLNIWIGGEPTFTDRHCATPEWTSNALGGDKETRAHDLARYLALHFPGCMILRTIGRQYSSETLPRWNLGLLSRRNGTTLWHGPPDPLLFLSNSTPIDLNLIRQAVADELQALNWSVMTIDSPTPPTLRLISRWDGQPIHIEHIATQHLHRPSIHTLSIPSTGLNDDLIAEGYGLILFDYLTFKAINYPSIELPGITNVDNYLALLAAIEKAALTLKLPTLTLRGYTPPIDQTLLWTTITPDPAVIEINQAPAANLIEQFNSSQTLFHAASQCGLAPYRLHYNGRESDSGGGGQLTIGGPTPNSSPFFIQPQLLPRLIRYFNHHPALSYWFGVESLGSGSQAPRPDEGPRERWLELAVALEQLYIHTPIDPEFLWASLSPLLVDSSGNQHRIEINIEKLWNKYTGTKGQLGLVELRPLRMAPDAITYSSIAALMRAIIARLMLYPFDLNLIEWGERLHGEFALPYYLNLDLQAVLADLAAYEFALGPNIQQLLLDDSRYAIGQLAWNGVQIRILSALEFWPLLGDVSTQQSGDSRLIDASTARIELRLTAIDKVNLDTWQVRINNFAAHLFAVPNTTTIRLTGIRYRNFIPWTGLHPKMPAQDRIHILLIPPASAIALSLTVLEWRPQGGAYPGLPQDLTEARLRRSERLIIEEIPIAALPEALVMPPSAINNAHFDMRRTAIIF